MDFEDCLGEYMFDVVLKVLFAGDRSMLSNK